MAAFPASSPACRSPVSLRSPLRSFRPEACESTAGSEEVYADAQARLTQWRKDFVGASSFDAQQGLRDLSHEQEHLKDLQADLAGIQGLVETASQLQVGGARLAEVLHSSSEAAASRAEAVASMCDQLHATCETHKQELQQEERKIARQQEVADSQHAEALKLLSTYGDRLGLAITRVAPQTVRMAFSLLDECNPDKEFSFQLGLGDLETSSEKSAEGYSVSKCIPHVPEMAKLVAQLNADASSVTSLPRFVCSMRRAFLEVPAAACAA